MDDLELGALELALVVSRFREAVADWDLAPAEMAGLLGLETPAGGADPPLVELGEDAEARLRLATEVAHLLRSLWTPAVTRSWLRDDEDGDQTPLGFMSKGRTELRSMRAALLGRLS